MISNELTNYPVIFIHGIAGTLKDWESTIKQISSDQYFDIRYLEKNKVYNNYYGEKVKQWFWNASYYTNSILEESINGNLGLYALRLKNIINLIKQITGHQKFVIIAHSMGGLVARKYMTLSQSNWDSVHKLLTVATPNLGIAISIDLIQQLRDLKRNSKFIEKLTKKWEEFYKNSDYKKWGVIGGINTKAGYSTKNDPNATDSAGIGYVEISSSIPYDEWKDAIDENIEKESFDTTNFGFRLAVKANHVEILENEGTIRGINWARTF